VNNPENVPTDDSMQYFFWSKEQSTIGQRSHLKVLLSEVGVTADELYGDDFTTLDDLSKWAADWGIKFLRAAQDAWFANEHYNRVQRELEENKEQELKELMASIVRGEL